MPCQLVLGHFNDRSSQVAQFFAVMEFHGFEPKPRICESAESDENANTYTKNGYFANARFWLNRRSWNAEERS